MNKNGDELRLLELFSGTKSVSKVARILGWETVSLDICPRHSPDLCMADVAKTLGRRPELADPKLGALASISDLTNPKAVAGACGSELVDSSLEALASM